ncbi:hypothetical protein CsSME_00036464 [Camellia sinensis var. sinensis]
MAAGGGGGGDESSAGRELDQTPTWAVALVCAVIVVISILLEKLLHGVGEWFRKRRKEPMLEALEKIKGELMVLGFISLLLTFGQIYIANVCIPTKLADTMLPCPIKHHGGHHLEPEHEPAPKEEPDHHRRLLWNDHRILAGGEPAKGCKKGYVPLISIHGLHQLHIFIFFLAVFHVIYSAITMTLGRLKIRGWKEWEHETETNDEFNDPNRFRLTHETSFVKEHTSFWVKSPFFFYFVCFFRQLFRSVNRADYLTMRHGFISVHLAPGTKFDFQKYIKRSLEDDFKVVVGISPVLWASAVIFLLLNVNGELVVLSVGTKLQAIITQMAVEIVERHAVVQGIPLVQVSDRHFWFGWPQLILHLIHITLFQNALELTYFFWIWYEFGLKSCFHQDFSLIIMRVALGGSTLKPSALHPTPLEEVGVQFLCSYITLPLYALVTQMGSTMKRSIFDDQTSKALRNWHKNALKKKSEGQPGPVATRTLGGGPGSPGVSPEHSPTLGRPSYAPPPNTNTSSANIIASVDVRAENAPSDHKGVELGNRDLLTGVLGLWHAWSSMLFERVFARDYRSGQSFSKPFLKNITASSYLQADMEPWDTKSLQCLERIQLYREWRPRLSDGCNLGVLPLLLEVISQIFLSPSKSSAISRLQSFRYAASCVTMCSLGLFHVYYVIKIEALPIDLLRSSDLGSFGPRGSLGLFPP